MKKIWVGVGIALLLVSSLAGCGKKNNENNQNPARVKDYVYRAEDIPMPDKDVNLSQLLEINGKIYGYALEYEWQDSEIAQPRDIADDAYAEEADVTDETEDAEAVTDEATEEEANGKKVVVSQEDTAVTVDMPVEGAPVEGGTEEIVNNGTAYFYYSFYEIKEDGTLGECHQIKGTDGEGYGSFCGDGEGNIYCILNKYYYGEGDEYYDDYYLEQISLDGDVFLSIKLNDIPQFKEMMEKNGYFNASDMFISGDYIYIYTSGNYVKLDKQGNYVGNMMNAADSAKMDGAQIVPMKDGQYAAISYGETGMTIAKIDIQNGTVGETYNVPGNSYDYSFYKGYQYDFLISDTYGVYGYNLGDENVVKLLSYVDSDIDTWRISGIVPISDTEFYGTYDSVNMGGSRIAKFTKVAPEDVKDKTVLTLAMASMDYELKSRVIAFNKSNELYRIDLQDYTSMYSENGDYQDGVSKLNTDIVSGKIPDIMLIDNSMPVDSYISKGLLADLYPFIDNDSEISREDFMPNIIEAFSENGKLYVLVPDYRIQTLIAKTSEVGRERGWTVADAVKLWDSKPEGTEFIAGATRSSIFYACMNYAADQFVDYETGKCDFNNDDFVQMLEFIKRFPEEISDDYYTDTYWENYDSMWRDGKVIAQDYYLTDFRDLNYAKYGTFGEDITLIGFPSANKDGSAILPARQLAISSKTKNQEGAWEFLRYFLSDEYQKETSGFPVRLKYLEQKAEEATKRPYYIDDDGAKVEYDDVIYIDGIEIKIDPMSKEEVDQYVEILKSFTQVSKYDETLMGIINEEAEPYFSGQKNAQEVAQIIQSRAQVYLNEIR